MKINQLRLKNAVKAMGWHFGASVVVALAVATIVFWVWFPYPYRQLAGGTVLFFIVMGVDIVCGPLLTLVLFNPAKPKRELVMDLSLVVVLQLAALAYGIWTVHQARPLYLVHEFDRFKVIALADVDAAELAKLPAALQPQLFKGPQTVGLREVSKEEREKVMFESVQGGRDYGERPGFYATYDAAKAYQKARPVADFVKKHPERRDDINKIVGGNGAIASQGGNQWRYLPIIARQDWVAVLNPQGAIAGYVQGDGF
ncbi:MAG: TfpX/TfpZ family type IV pilin accessory protein [Burkholderiaceae bacterium]|nr:TfpX/TfpZ family type IV pilin accessory protein [Burkholderiaceae bacterium]